MSIVKHVKTKNKPRFSDEINRFVERIKKHSDVVKITYRGRETVILYEDWTAYPPIKNKARKIHPDEKV